MPDILGPGSGAANVVTARPTDDRTMGATDTWIKACSAPGANDGTIVPAGWANQIVAQLRTAIRTAGVTDDNADDAMLWKAMLAASAARVPVGSIVLWPSSGSPPSGWLKINGAAVSRATYGSLWAFAQVSGMLVTDTQWTTVANGLWTSFSSGDGSSTFRVPDWRGEFPRFWDDARGVDPSRVLGAWQNGTLNVGEIVDGVVGFRRVQNGNLNSDPVSSSDIVSGGIATSTTAPTPSVTSQQFTTSPLYLTKSRPRNATVIPLIRAL